MKIKKLLLSAVSVAAAAALLLSTKGDCLAQFKDIFRDIKGAVSGGSGHSGSKIAEGLKEALRIGTENAVAIVSKKDGFLGEEAIRILLPPSIKKTERLLRAAGYGNSLDEFEVSMNRAAEKFLRS